MNINIPEKIKSYDHKAMIKKKEKTFKAYIFCFIGHSEYLQLTKQSLVAGLSRLMTEMKYANSQPQIPTI